MRSFEVNESDRAALSPMPTADLEAGGYYDTWVCEACLTIIAVAPRTPRADPQDMPDALISVECPCCGKKSDYSMHARRVRRFPWNAEEA